MFLTGYPTVSVLLQAFVSINRLDAPFAPALMGEGGWWEYDLLIGAVAFGALLYLGIWLRWRPTDALRRALEGTEYRQLDWPMGLMAVLSMGALYGAIAALPVPLMNTLANPSRFLITPVLLLLVIACIRFDRVLATRRSLSVPARGAVDCLVLSALIQTAFELAAHSKAWAARNWQRLPDGAEVGSETAIVNIVDPVYEWSVHTSAAITAVTLLLWGYRYLESSRLRGISGRKRWPGVPQLARMLHSPGDDARRSKAGPARLVAGSAPEIPLQHVQMGVCRDGADPGAPRGRVDVPRRSGEQG
jgi:hypothetical protein